MYWEKSMEYQASSSPVILFVDDEPATVKYFQRTIGQLAPVVTAHSGEDGKQVLDRNADTLCVLVCDQRMPGLSGNELLRYAKENYPNIVRILTTAYSEIEETVNAINDGHVQRYIQKPWDLTALQLELKQVLEFARVRRERDDLLYEKSSYFHSQIVANRISALYLLCSSLVGALGVRPFEHYLTAAEMLGVRAAGHNWITMNHLDLAAREAERAAGHVAEVKKWLDLLSEKYQGENWRRTADVFFDFFGSEYIKVRPLGSNVESDETALDIIAGNEFAQFLSADPNDELSTEHAKWLASLVWLEKRMAGVHLSKTGDALSLKFVPVGPTPDKADIAYWATRF